MVYLKADCYHAPGPFHFALKFCDCVCILSNMLAGHRLRGKSILSFPQRWAAVTQGQTHPCEVPSLDSKTTPA